MPTVVVDSSSFIHLTAIGRMELMRELYGRVLTPPAVWQEVVAAGQARSGEAELRRALNES